MGVMDDKPCEIQKIIIRCIKDKKEQKIYLKVLPPRIRIFSSPYLFRKIILKVYYIDEVLLDEKIEYVNLKGHRTIDSYLPRKREMKGYSDCTYSALLNDGDKDYILILDRISVEIHCHNRTLHYTYPQNPELEISIEAKNNNSNARNNQTSPSKSTLPTYSDKPLYSNTLPEQPSNISDKNNTFSYLHKGKGNNRDAEHCVQLELRNMRGDIRAVLEDCRGKRRRVIID